MKEVSGVDFENSFHFIRDISPQKVFEVKFGSSEVNFKTFLHFRVGTKGYE